MKIKKKFGLMLIHFWYCLSVTTITPVIIKYLYLDFSILTEFCAEIISVGVPVAFLAMRRERCNKNNLLYKIYRIPIRSVGYPNVVLSIIVCIALFFGIYYIFNTCEIIYIYYTNDFSSVNIQVGSNIQTFFLSLVVYALLPAIYEEILYRGMYFDAFHMNNIGVLYLVSSLMFASAHSGIVSIVNALVVGIILMQIYQKYRSLALTILLHFIYNLFSIIFTNYISLPYSALSILKDYANKVQMKASVIISFGVSGIMLIVVLLGLMAIIKKRDNIEMESKDKLSISVIYKVIDCMQNIFFVIFALVIIIMKTKK